MQDKNLKKKNIRAVFTAQPNSKFKLKSWPNCCPVQPSGPWWGCKAFWETSRCPHVTELLRQLVNLHNFFFLHTHLSLYLRVHACVCMCVYILAMGLDPSELRHCFASCWAWEKDGTPFHSCLGRGPGCWGPPCPLYTHPQFPLVRLPPPPPPPSIPFRLRPTCFQKQDPLPSAS